MMESVDAAAGQLADTTINGQDRQDVSSVEVAEKRDENGSGSSGKVEQVEREEEEVNEVEDDSEKLAEGTLEKASLFTERNTKVYLSVVPERRTEVRQMGLPVGSSALVKKDIATVTSPVEIKQIKIGDPKLRAKLCFEVVTARVIESAGKKHVVRNDQLLYTLFEIFIFCPKIQL